MVDVYAPKRARVAAVLRRWNSGAVTLTRTTRGTPAPDKPWLPGPVTGTDVYTLDAIARGVAADYINGTTIVASDLVITASPKARLDGLEVDLVPRMSDVIGLDGEAKIIKKIQPVPAAGLAARYEIFVGA